MPLGKNRIVKAHALLSEKVFLRPHYLKLVFGKMFGKFYCPPPSSTFSGKSFAFRKNVFEGGGGGGGGAKGKGPKFLNLPFPPTRYR
jgi:hypothetical protein